MGKNAVLILLLLCCALMAGCQTQLFGSLSEAEANAVLAALRSGSIRAEKKAAGEGAFAIFVEEEDFAAAVKLLDDQGLPGRTYADFGTVFGGDGMFNTPLEDRARYLFALQEDIARTIATIDGVLEARVHLVLQEQDQLGRQVQTPSAAVLVKHIDDARHDPVGHLSTLRKLIGAAVPNMSEEHIQVSFTPVPPRAEPVLAQTWREVAGIRVMAGSERRLVALLAGLGIGCLALAGLAVVLAVRSRRRSK